MQKNFTLGMALKMKLITAIATFTFLIGITFSYLYFKASPDYLYSKYYHPFHLQITRGASEKSAIRDAYAKGKMDSVISKFNALSEPAEEEYLLTGIAFLEKNQPEKAIETFQMLISKNKNAKSDFFEEDAEYYLAMSYLSNHEIDKAIPIFEKIQADPEAKYNSEVSEWFLLNVRTSSIAKQ